VSLEFQRNKLLQTFGVELNAKIVNKAELKTKVIRKNDASS
jgi:hypothetical protein